MSRAVVTALHHEAMELAEQASVELLRGNEAQARQLTRQAFERERDAASHLTDDLDFEPTRSVLYRSAASLALDCGETREAERLIAVALSGKPPDEIADELRDLLEQVHFQRHLDLRGVVLAPEELQISIVGAAVGFGVAQSEAFLSRLQDFEKLVYRTAERKRGYEFRERGKPKDKVIGDVQLFISVPRAASFAVSVRIGHAAQLTLDGRSFPEAIANELLDCIDLFNSENFVELRRRIPDPSYLRNLVALAKRIAPDGKAVNMVGLTAQSGGRQRRVTLTHSQFDISVPDLEEPLSTSEVVRITGSLKFADSLRSNRDEIRILDEHGGKHRILVPKGMMDDIVRPLWDSPVEVTGRREDKMIRLQDIRKLDAAEEP